MADDALTIIRCGPKKDCEHDYSGWRDIVEHGEVVGGTAVCAKCGHTAYEEAQWL